MPRSIIQYDKDLPEIPNRRPWEKPTSHLVKDDTAPTNWREKPGRRASDLLLVEKLRAAVDDWRARGYTGASTVARRLFEYWFEEDHEVSGFNSPFRYYFGQREAIETLVYLFEIYDKSDTVDLIRAFAEIRQADLWNANVVFQTTMDGQRQIRRIVSEQETAVQDLPPPDLRRYAFKMATGSGKTWVMAMAVVWSYFHKKFVPASTLSTNFLIIAPNIIVFERLAKDFDSNRIFNTLPLVPPEWRGKFGLKVILREESTEPDPSGNLFLTNIHQVYESQDKEWTPQNAVDAILGRKPVKDLASYQRSMLERIKDLRDLVVMNDEAHHVHDEDLAWHKALMNIHAAIPHGIALWLDFSATPKDQNGMYYPWTLCDYPLAQAVEDRIVKAPIIVSREDDPKLPRRDPENVTKDNVVEKYGYWIQAAISRWKDHYKVYKPLASKPVLFIMAEKNAFADRIGEYLWKTREFGFRQNEVLVIHTDSEGEILKSDLPELRRQAHAIDEKDSKIKAIVSVMMLKEGWDVKNVTVVLGLRPFTAQAKILPEQVVGRGLRLMAGIGPDRIQTLEVLGTRELLNDLRGKLEIEGVGVATARSDPPKPVIIQPIDERKQYDIHIPITKPRLTHNIRKLSTLDPLKLDAIYDQDELEETFRITLKMEFQVTETQVHQADIATVVMPMTQEILASITRKVMETARLPNVFSELYPIVRDYVANRCFGTRVNLDDDAIRTHLARLEMKEGIAKYLARKIAELMVEKRELEFEKADFRLSHTKPFSWRRNLPPLQAERTIFNYVATYNDYERRFAEFLDNAPDVIAFASLGTTEQGESGTEFRVDYLKPSGAIGLYHPDWVVVQKNAKTRVNWIIETKGRVWEGTEAKDTAMNDWCERISKQTGQTWKFARVNQLDFDVRKPKTLAEAVEGTDQADNRLI